MPLSGDKGAGKKGANSEKSLGPPLQLRKELSRERLGSEGAAGGARPRENETCNAVFPIDSWARGTRRPALLFPGPGAPAEGEATSGHWAQEPPTLD